jgi:integrase
MRHILTKAVQWGIITSNSLKAQIQFKKADYGEHQRDRLVEDWEISEALSVKSNYRGVKIANPYIRFKLMTGLRRNDIFRLRLSNIRNDGIHLQPHKTRYSSGKRLIIEWDDYGELRDVVDEILRISPRRIGDAPLFTTREGKAYINEDGISNAFDSLWQRFMDRVMAETKVTDRFQERDLRAKVASDSDTLVEASERLSHTDTATTQRVYRRKPVRVKPLLKRGKRDSIG